MLSALAHCHRHNVVHRDVKLSNFVFWTKPRASLRREGESDARSLPAEANTRLLLESLDSGPSGDEEMEAKEDSADEDADAEEEHSHLRVEIAQHDRAAHMQGQDEAQKRQRSPPPGGANPASPGGRPKRQKKSPASVSTRGNGHTTSLTGFVCVLCL